MQIKGLLVGIYPPLFHLFREYGLYVFRFYKNCEWLYVITDELLPCDKFTKLLFANSKHQNRFWVSIIEKAYAKLHGTYYDLTFGFPEEAFSDLTGLPSKRYRMRTPQNTMPSELKDSTWKNLRDAYLNGFMLSCNNEGQKQKVEKVLLDGKYDTGLLYNHAYAIDDVYDVTVRSSLP